MQLTDWLGPKPFNFLRSIHRNVFKNGSTGLAKIDLHLAKYINPDNNGFYIELGANDGISQSNTFRLQHHFDWQGLLIEPSPINYQKCIDNRSFRHKPTIVCAACVSPDYKEKFVEIVDANLMSAALNLDLDSDQLLDHTNSGLQYLNSPKHSFIYGAVAKTLTQILNEIDAPSLIDFLSLDVEGNELSVLKGICFEKYRIKWILVEVRKNDSSVQSFLEENGYMYIATLQSCSTHSDILFELKS